MNRPSTEPHQSTQAPNPFLAAAAAMPPPPGPVLPPIHKSVPVQVDLRPAEPPPFRQEFPISAAETPDSDIPTPWTLPFMPVPSAPASPAMVLPAPPAAVRAPAVAPDAALPSGLVKDVLRALEEGRRALTETFQSLIGKLEATLTAPPPVPIAVLQPPAPPVEPAGEPVISHAVELPSLLASPEPAAPPRERTTHVPLPPVIAAMPLPVLPPAPVTKPIPAPTGPEESAPAAPRRKFAKPSGLAAQQLSTALHQVFETPPPASNGNGYPGNGAPPAPLPPRTPLADSPFHAMPAMPAPPPALRTQAPVPDSVYSPFAVSSAPLSSPDGRPDEPVPFTLLMNKGAQFEPAPVSAPVGLYDPLDDTALPWMQPLSGPAPRH